MKLAILLAASLVLMGCPPTNGMRAREANANLIVARAELEILRIETEKAALQSHLNHCPSCELRASVR